MSNVYDECWSYWFYYKNPSCQNICPLGGYLHLMIPVERDGWIEIDVAPENVNMISNMLSLNENSTHKTLSGNETIGEAVKRINKGLAKRLETCAVHNFMLSPETKVPKEGETVADRVHCAIFEEPDLRNTLIMCNCIMAQLEHYEQFRF
ncbi:unnamed protein product [Orchesella dallaii]|uniref:Uncharacterized protein n=1 Tax=Orchesella dallaii TaxID=48710 RepID=A0ABP1PX72_9HEXA